MTEIPLNEGSNPMATEQAVGDISTDELEMLQGESIRSHQALMHDSRANEQVAHSILRFTGVKKFNEVDPIEAASVEMILGKAQVKGPAAGGAGS